MSILNKSVYREYQHLLGNDDDSAGGYAQLCPLCNDGTLWGNCRKHYTKSLMRYIEAFMWYTQLLETRTVQAEDRAMVCGKQNYELRNALSASKRNAKHYRNVALELGDKIRTLNIDKR